MTTDLNAMLVFASVVKHGGFTAASRALSLPKSTISRKVAQLEAELGVRLLERTTRRLRVTEAGAQFFEHCERISAEAESAARAMSQLHQTPRGTLRVTTDPVFGTAFLPGLVAGYLAEFPEVDVQVVLSAERLDLIAEGFDVAIWIGQLPDSTYIARLLGREQQILCASPSYLARRGAPKRPVDFGEHDCLVFGARPGPASWRLVDVRGHVEALRVNGRLKASDMALLHGACRDGLGIASLPSFLAAPDLRDGRLAQVLPGWSTQPLPLYVVFPSVQGQPAKVMSFVERVVSSMEEAFPWGAELRRVQPTVRAASG